VTNPFSPQESAAADALDILEEQAEFERELASSNALQAELADFQAAVNDLAYAVPLVPLPAGLKGKLFDRLDRVDSRPANLLDLLDWPIVDLQQVMLDLNSWEPFPVPIGSEREIWQIDEARAQVAFFLRMPMGGMLPNHWHATGESILVLEGKFVDDDGAVYEVGNRFVAAADTSHQPIASPGCIILSVTSIHDKILVSNV
jgi:ChrR Cupin-like domain